METQKKKLLRLKPLRFSVHNDYHFIHQTGLSGCADRLVLPSPESLSITSRNHEYVKRTDCAEYFFFFISKGSRSSWPMPLWLRSGFPALVVAPGLHLRSPLAPPSHSRLRTNSSDTTCWLGHTRNVPHNHRPELAQSVNPLQPSRALRRCASFPIWSRLRRVGKVG